jgi:DnaJ-class molecular chaperone
MSIKTHYEALKVARDAPSDVIRAAYKAITQKFNAEHYPSAEESRLMKSIHDSYGILSNPLKRAEYDRWLLERESAEVGKKGAGDPEQSQTLATLHGSRHRPAACHRMACFFGQPR